LILASKRVTANTIQKYTEIGGSEQSADQQKREGWDGHGLLSRYLLIVKLFGII
jgi:hypothetical protein